MTKYRVKDLMSKDVYTVYPETSLQDLVKAFKKQSISGAPVVDKNGKLVGVITKTNLMNAQIESSGNMDPYPEFYHLAAIHTHTGGAFDFVSELSGAVKDYMSKELFTIREEDSASEACKMMMENKIHRLLVLNKNKLCGIITALDIMKVYPSIAVAEEHGNEDVRSVMKPKVVTIGVDQSLSEAFKTLEDHGIRQLPVLEKGKIVGIITDRDLRRAQVSNVVNPEAENNDYYMDTILVGEIMTQNPETVTPNDSIRDAALKLLRFKIGGLPVVDPSQPSKLVGILTGSDIMRHYVNA